MRFKAKTVPLPIMDEILSDEEARSKLRTLLDTGYYETEKGK